MIIRSYVNGFEIQDRTSDLLLVPNQWGLMQQLNLFSTEGVADATVVLEKITKGAAVLVDKQRGERATVGKDQTRELRSFVLPHFPHDEYITPRDIQGKLAFGSPEQAENLGAVRARKLERIRWNHAWTLETARCHTLVTGSAYAPSGTVSVNWYDEFGAGGIAGRPVVGFGLNSPATEVLNKIEEVIALVQDNLLSGEIAQEVVVVTSPEFFTKLITHPSIKTAYQFYASSQEPLRNRQNGGPDARYREFSHAGLRFIEYRGVYNGVRLIPANEAYALPLGTQETFQTYFGPAEKFDTVNTVGQEAYVFEYADPRGEKIELQSESNFLNVIRRPDAVIKLTVA
jgi:hypothetical protein